MNTNTEDQRNSHRKLRQNRSNCLQDKVKPVGNICRTNNLKTIELSFHFTSNVGHFHYQCRFCVGVISVPYSFLYTLHVQCYFHCRLLLSHIHFQFHLLFHRHVQCYFQLRFCFRVQFGFIFRCFFV